MQTIYSENSTQKRRKPGKFGGFFATVLMIAAIVASALTVKTCCPRAWTAAANFVTGTEESRAVQAFYEVKGDLEGGSKLPDALHAGLWVLQGETDKA